MVTANFSREIVLKIIIIQKICLYLTLILAGSGYPIGGGYGGWFD